MNGRGIARRIALAAVASAGLGLVILVVGVQVVGRGIFADLMKSHGGAADEAQQMFDQSVTVDVAIAAGVAILASVGLALFLAQRLAQPLARIGAAARRVADGDYAT